LVVWQEGTAIPPPRQRALLSLLLVEDGPVSLREIGRSLWSEAGSVTNVHVLVHRLRRWLSEAGIGEIRLTPSGYVLEVPVGTVDADRFREQVGVGRQSTVSERVEALASALALWRGPVLSGAPERVRNRRDAHRLQALRRDTMVDLVETCLAVGQADRLCHSSTTSRPPTTTPGSSSAIRRAGKATSTCSPPTRIRAPRTCPRRPPTRAAGTPSTT